MGLKAKKAEERALMPLRRRPDREVPSEGSCCATRMQELARVETELKSARAAESGRELSALQLAGQARESLLVRQGHGGASGRVELD